ncbi:nucleoside triphosphate pyrophosphohydrolase [Rhizobium sp. BT-226]|uniref:nucleoside triphosphate pyrophosphohydrolase n=1 Tax=Rhizobium sp. BT-226 TaxID=2986922 RepID=UPI0021F70905|nr:nucleoside triphosphate pyrophosphohydrolase [Rhizobium sp. BT-226]MCW0016060.1 nucleoside triphosphate pyrophosphohydrolase [Rhizobium sp. BT-226]
MLETPSDRATGIGREYERFQAHCREFGAKSAGLAIVPAAWTPPYISICSALYELWKQNKSSISLDTLKSGLKIWMEDARKGLCDGFIVRSSGVNEHMSDRGQFKSIEIPINADSDQVIASAYEIFEHAESRGAEQAVAIVLQVFLKPDGAGHLSNEIRLTPTRNQWVYEAALPAWAAPKGLNSKFAPRPDPHAPLRVRGVVAHATMRSVGQWINETVAPRAHVEWIISRKQFWIVQLDLEWHQLDTGVDPTVFRKAANRSLIDWDAARVFEHHIVGTKTRWKKLQNLEEFDFDGESSPRLYLATADRVDAALNSNPIELVKEIDALSAGKCVVRMEVVSKKISSFNLPRTDTVNGTRAISWLRERIERYRNDVDSLEDIAFILHAFLPAFAGVWAYANPGEPIAFVDALWGLPDGLQVLPHDSYQVDVHHSVVSAKRIRYKPRFLCEMDDGTWRYVDVLRSKSRSSTLSDKDAIEIGIRTSAIASKLNQRAQIMWFAGVDSEYGVGRNLPWFRARETVDPAPRQATKFPLYKVSNFNDLKNIPNTPVTLNLNPEAELIRQDNFLDAVIEKASERRLPVEIHGSTLSHTYYRLFNAGVAVNPPSFGEYSRTRRRKVFGKLVRDKIPDRIRVGGELVKQAYLPKSELSTALLGKFMEEVRELHLANGSINVAEELSDIAEILRSYAANAGIDWEAVEEARDNKAKSRGSFTERRVLIETSFSKPRAPVDQRQEISLQEMETPYSVGKNGVVFPFWSLFSTFSSARVNTDDGDIFVSVRLEARGLLFTVEQIRRVEPTEEQLSLF